MLIIHLIHPVKRKVNTLKPKSSEMVQISIHGLSCTPQIWQCLVWLFCKDSQDSELKDVAVNQVNRPQC